MTVTVIQGRGTALYTPLEQYGGDGLHTDVRSDIYAFGATLYHLLTNQPPVDARQRFLHPESLVPPRAVNAAISPRSERAILWAMELHPDDRPASVEIFRDFIVGNREIPTRPPNLAQADESLLRLINKSPERLLLWTVAGMLLLSLVASLAR
jgi:serine/threonine-protein kinase